MNVRLVDVGGARHERLKWGSQFLAARADGTVGAGALAAIIFVVALDSVFQRLEEDASVNKMQDALDLFRLVCAEPSIASVPKILVLNKLDAFEQQFIKEVAQFRGVFPAYTGEINASVAAQYVSNVFTGGDKHIRVAIDSCVKSNYRRSTVRAVFERFCQY